MTPRRHSAHARIPLAIACAVRSSLPLSLSLAGARSDHHAFEPVHSLSLFLSVRVPVQLLGRFCCAATQAQTVSECVHEGERERNRQTETETDRHRERAKLEKPTFDPGPQKSYNRRQTKSKQKNTC